VKITRWVAAVSAAGVLAAGAVAAPALAQSGPSSGLNGTVTVLQELSLSLSAASLNIGAGLAGATETTSPSAVTATVTSYDPSGYVLNLDGPSGTQQFTGTTNPSDAILFNGPLSILQGSNTLGWGGASMYTLGQASGVSGAGCGHQPGCSESGSADAYGFGMSVNIPSSAVPDTYSAQFTAQLLGN
jgi:hypothetical protein